MNCPKCTAEAWNLAAQKSRDDRSPEAHEAAKRAQREHKAALEHDQVFLELVAVVEGVLHSLTGSPDCEELYGDILKPCRKVLSKLEGGAQ
jgi:hypothetical protein